MGIDVPEVRPRVLSDDLVERLGDYLRFRHLVRNVYGFELDESKMESLVAEIEDLHRSFDQEMQAFIAYLESLGRETSG